MGSCPLYSGDLFELENIGAGFLEKMKEENCRYNFSYISSLNQYKEASPYFHSTNHKTFVIFHVRVKVDVNIGKYFGDDSKKC